MRRSWTPGKREAPKRIFCGPGGGSNPRPRDYESPALTTELRARGHGILGGYRQPRETLAVQIIRWLTLLIGVLGVFATWWSVISTLVVPRGGTSFIGKNIGRECTRSFGNGETLQHIRASRFNSRSASAVVHTCSAGCLAVVVRSLLASFALAIDGTFACRDSQRDHLVPLHVGLCGTVTCGVVALDFVAAMTGPLIVALQIGYLPTLYASFARREALVTLLDAHAGSPPWGPELWHAIIWCLASIASPTSTRESGRTGTRTLPRATRTTGALSFFAPPTRGDHGSWRCCRFLTLRRSTWH